MGLPSTDGLWNHLLTPLQLSTHTGTSHFSFISLQTAALQLCGRCPIPWSLTVMPRCPRQTQPWIWSQTMTQSPAIDPQNDGKLDLKLKQELRTCMLLLGLCWCFLKKKKKSQEGDTSARPHHPQAWRMRTGWGSAELWGLGSGGAQSVTKLRCGAGKVHLLGQLVCLNNLWSTPACRSQSGFNRAVTLPP